MKRIHCATILGLGVLFTGITGCYGESEEGGDSAATAAYEISTTAESADSLMMAPRGCLRCIKLCIKSGGGSFGKCANICQDIQKCKQ